MTLSLLFNIIYIFIYIIISLMEDTRYITANVLGRLGNNIFQVMYPIIISKLYPEFTPIFEKDKISRYWDKYWSTIFKKMPLVDDISVDITKLHDNDIIIKNNCKDIDQLIYSFV